LRSAWLPSRQCFFVARHLFTRDVELARQLPMVGPLLAPLLGLALCPDLLQ